MDASVWQQPVSYGCPNCHPQPQTAPLQAIIQWIGQYGPNCSGCGARLNFPPIVGQAWQHLQQQRQQAAPPPAPGPAPGPAANEAARYGQSEGRLSAVPIEQGSPAPLDVGGGLQVGPPLAQAPISAPQPAAPAAPSAGGGGGLDLLPDDDEPAGGGRALDRCPFCFEDVDPAQPRVVCAACRTNHHLKCWGEGGVKCLECGCDEPADVST